MYDIGGLGGGDESLLERIKNYFSEKWEYIRSGEWSLLLEDKKFVAGVVLLFLLVGVLLWQAFSSTEAPSAVSFEGLPTEKVCVYFPDGFPISGAELLANDVRSFTDEEGCARIPPADRIRVRKAGFEPYFGPPESSITLTPITPELVIRAVGANDYVIAVVRDGKTLAEGEEIRLRYVMDLEHGEYIYPEAAVARLIINGEVVDEKPLPSEGGELVLMPRTGELALKATYTVKVDVVHPDLDYAILSVVDSKGIEVFRDRGIQFRVELPPGRYSFTVSVVKDDRIIGRALKDLYVDSDITLVFDNFQEVQEQIVTVISELGGTLYVVKDGSVVRSWVIKEGEQNISVPEGAELIFISDDKTTVKRMPPSEIIEIKRSSERHTLKVKVLKAGEPVTGATVYVSIGPVKIISLGTGANGEVIFKLSPEVYNVCALYGEMEACTEVELSSDREISIDLLSTGLRELYITLNGRPVDGTLTIGERAYTIRDGKLSVPNGSFEAVVKTTDGKEYRVVIRRDDSYLELERGFSAPDTYNLVVNNFPGAVVTVTGGGLMLTRVSSSSSISFELPPGYYSVYVLANGASAGRTLQLSEDSIVELFPESNEELYSLSVSVDERARCVIHGGDIYFPFTGGNYGFLLPQGTYVVSCSLAGRETHSVVKVPETDNVSFDFNVERGLELRLLSIDGREVAYVEEGKDYVLRVEVLSDVTTTLKVNDQEVTVPAGQSIQTFKLTAGPRGIAVKAVLNDVRRSLRIPAKDYEVLCYPSGVCLGSGVKGENYVWTVINRAERALSYQVLAGDQVIISEESLGEEYEGSLPVFLFYDSGGATHLFLVENEVFERIYDPVDRLFALPGTAGVSVEPPTIPPVSWPVNILVISDTKLTDVSIYVEGKDCAPGISVEGEEFYSRPREGGGFTYYADINAVVDPGNCQTLRIYVYSEKDGVRPSYAELKVSTCLWPWNSTTTSWDPARSTWRWRSGTSCPLKCSSTSTMLHSPASPKFASKRKM